MRSELWARSLWVGSVSLAQKCDCLIHIEQWRVSPSCVQGCSEHCWLNGIYLRPNREVGNVRQLVLSP